MDTDAELMAELHRELDRRATRVSRIALGLAFLALLGLWCWSQQVAP